MPGDWKSASPSPRDIVTAYFPETKPKGAIRLRPCIVLDVFESEEPRSEDEPQFAARICYGTKNLRHKSLEKIDLVVQNHADMDAMGLAYATRFSLDHESIVVLPWDDENFGCWNGYPSPVIGFLDDEYSARLDRRLERRAKKASRSS